MDTCPFSLLPDRFFRTKTFAQGSFVFRQGAPTMGLLRVRSGEVCVQRVGVDGGVTMMHRAVEGELFAEASIFSKRYHCDAQCVESCNVDVVEKSLVLSEIGSNALFSRVLMAHMARGQQAARELLALRNVPSAQQRILAGLRLGLMRGTVSDFAEHIGITPAACYRSLRVLTANGQLVKTGRGRYQLI